MRDWKPRIAIALVLITVAVILGGICAKPVWAQVRAALVRDIDTPALAPYRAGVDYTLTFINGQQLLTTVPAGKRLVIEYISFWSGTSAVDDELVFGGLRIGEFGPVAVTLEIHPRHASALGATIQDGSQVVKAYFEPGEQVWVSMSHNTAAARSVHLRVRPLYNALRRRAVRLVHAG